MRIPFLAATPVPTIMAVGVASASAHGQAMINTATAAVNAVFNKAAHVPLHLGSQHNTFATCPSLH